MGIWYDNFTNGLQVIEIGASMDEYRHISTNGYVYVRDTDGIMGKAGAIVPEHRLVMTKAIGRKLRHDEHVHHLDKNKTNNDLSNLIIVNPKEHGHYHRGEKKNKRKATVGPKFEGRAVWVKLRCPNCGKVFYRPKRETVLSKPNKLGVNLCSNHCAALFEDALESHTITDYKQRKAANVICLFKTNNRFMSEFLSRRNRYWVIDDSGVFHS